MSSIRLPACLLFLVLGACAAPAPEPAPAPPVDAAAVRDAITARERDWSAAFMTASGTNVAAMYAEDAASIPPVGEWDRGRDAIARTMQNQFDTTTFTAREDITDEVIPLGSDYAFEIGHYSSAGTAKKGGKARTSSGRYIVLWRKDADGVWRILRDMGSEAPAAKP